METKESSLHLYANPEWAGLSVQNPHFNIVDTYDFYSKHQQNEQAIETHLHQQIESAFAEDFLGTGRYDLEFITQPDGSMIFSNPSFPDQGLEMIAQRTILKKQQQHEPYERELQEAELATQLTQFCDTAPMGAHCLWTSPPGKETDYPAQMSITYLGEIQSSPTSSNGKKMHVELIVHKLSLCGHQKLIETVDHTLPGPHRTNTDFIGELHLIKEDSPLQTIDQLKTVISELEANGHIDSKAKPQVYITDQVLKDALPQIHEFCHFLKKIFAATYTAKGLQISQFDINNLEKAYSLGYRSVLNHFKHQRQVTAEDMFQDLSEAERISTTLNRRESITPAEVWLANTFMAKLSDRYGDLHSRQIGGVGCPGGTLTGFEFGIEQLTVNGIEYDFLSSISTHTESVMKCVTCPFCHKTVDAIVTSTHIVCPECHASAEKN